VARRVAESLGWRLVDNAFIDGIARGLHKTPAAVQAIDERAPSLAERLADALALGGGEVVSASLATPMPPTEQRVADATREVIVEAVARGPVVVVGRGAQALLAERADVLHVNCYAPHEKLVERVMMRDSLSREEADKLVRTKNQQREQYVKRTFGREWLAPEHYDIMLNTASLGIDRCVELVLELARERIGK
jgi:cytidylate kinase